MKRIFILLMAFLMFSVCSFAENLNIDLSVYSNEELQILKSMIEEELLSRQGYEPWFDYGLGQYIPKIKLFSADELSLKTTVVNDDNHFYLTVMETEKEDFENYIEVLKIFGFDENVDRSATVFSAENEDGWKITLKYSQLIKYLNIEAFAN